jgi:hypothetical protein
MKFVYRMILKRILLIASLTLIISTVQAQPDPGEDPDVPLDGGVAFLIVSGAALGIKKINDQRKLGKENK